MDTNRLTQLEAALRTGPLHHRQAALDDLAQMPSDIAVPILQRLSTAPDFLCRRFAAMGLGNHLTPDSFGVLKARLGDENDDNVLAEIANALFEFGDPALPLLEQLFTTHPNWLIRQTIIAIVMETKQDQLLLALIQVALLDDAQAVRETAILALGRLLKGPLQSEALALLMELATAEAWRDRWRAATALTLATDATAKPVLAKLQQDSNHYVAAAALESSL